MDHYRPVERIDLLAAVSASQGPDCPEPHHRHRWRPREGTVSSNRTQSLERGHSAWPQGHGADDCGVAGEPETDGGGQG